MSPGKVERPALLIQDEEPTYLFGATDGYLLGGRVSSNVQIALAPAIDRGEP